MAERREEIAQWAENQRALARALGLTIDDWMRALDAAGARRTGVYAASVGAAMARKLSLAALEGFDSVALASRARGVIDPKPPRVSSPLLAEAIRRADELGAGPVRSGASRLKRKSAASAAAASERATALPTPARDTKPLSEWASADDATPDAPGAAAKAKRSRKKRGSDEDAE